MTLIFGNSTIFWNISKWNKGFLSFDILLVHLITILTFLEVSSREVYKKQNKNYQFYGIDSMVSSLQKKKNWYNNMIYIVIKISLKKKL